MTTETQKIWEVRRYFDDNLEKIEAKNLTKQEAEKLLSCLTKHHRPYISFSIHKSQL